ncbi:MAG: glycosyltransferase family 1 protein [Verrucomicrobiota bacterium]
MTTITRNRIIIDGTSLGRRKTGNETYIRGLLDGFEALNIKDSNLNISLITTEKHKDTRSQAFDWIEIPEGNFFSRNYLTIPSQLRSHKADIYHATYWTRWWDLHPPKVVMIHDISFVSFPEGFLRHERLFYASVVRQVAKAAAQIMTVSEYSKQNMIDHWKLPEDKITVTYNGIDSCFQSGISLQDRSSLYPDLAGKMGAGRNVESISQVAVNTGKMTAVGDQNPYILYVGNLHPRKNVARLLKAFVQLKRQEKIPHRLVIVGQQAWMTGDIFEVIRSHRLEDSVSFTGYISQNELVEWYQNACVMVYPSLFEGFGLPPLEAMACGCPVVASNTTSIPEVVGDAAILVDPESVDEIASGIWRLLKDENLRKSFSMRGLSRASKFSWRQCALRTLHVYDRLLWDKSK